MIVQGIVGHLRVRSQRSTTRLALNKTPNTRGRTLRAPCSSSACRAVAPLHGTDPHRRLWHQGWEVRAGQKPHLPRPYRSLWPSLPENTLHGGSSNSPNWRWK